MSTLPAQPEVAQVSPATLDMTALTRQALAPVASLKLTIVSFVLAIGIIFIGTLAQVDRDIWEVLELYFKSWFARIEATVFFPRSWFPGLATEVANRWFAISVLVAAVVGSGLTVANLKRGVASASIAGSVLFAGALISISTLLTGAFWYPGGALIGATMCMNLLAAHAVRFKIQASGQRLWIGLGVTLLGVLLSVLVVTSGHNSDGFQGEPPFGWQTLWLWVKAGLSVAAAGLLGYAAWSRSTNHSQLIVKRICGFLGLASGVLAVWLWTTPESSYLGDSGMRILWQLILGLLAGTVLLFGCVALFRRRAGIVVLHSGIGLMMFGQWFVSNYDVEEQMTMAEGQTMNYGQDIRSVELAIIDRNSDEFAGMDDVIVIPMTRNGHPTRYIDSDRIEDPRLPFSIEVVEYLPSSRIERSQSDSSNPANSGRGTTFQAVPVRGASGASGSEVNLAAGYFRFIAEDGTKLGTYLLSQDQLMMRDGRTFDFSTESIRVGEKSYDAQLRFVRNYKDYSIQLLDVSKDDYLGTSVPRNYSSTVRLEDLKRGVDQELKIWMNNPRRYAGETFYQSGWQMDRAGNEYTTLQVVRNHGWLIPYVACMICMVGMLAHFSQVLVRFLDRQSRSLPAASADNSTPDISEGQGDQSSRKQTVLWLVPSIVVAVAIMITYLVARPPSPEPGGMDLYEFGRLPLVYQGRVKPFDTLARNSLRVISDAETFVGVLPPDELDEQWEQIESTLKDHWKELDEADLTPYKRRGDVAGLIELIQDKTNADNYAVTQYVEDLMCRRQSAARWLLDLISGSERSRRHKVVRIYHPQVLDTLGLKRRKGYRYSLEEMAPQMDEFQSQAFQAENQRQEDVEKLSLYQRKLLDLDRRLRQIILLHRAFTPPELPPLPTPEEFENDMELARSKVVAFQQAVVTHDQRLKEIQPPLSVAPIESDQSWQAYSAAWPVQFLQTRFLGREATPSFQALNEILVSYADNDIPAFNGAVQRYHTELRNNPPTELQPTPSAATTFVTTQFGSFYGFESFFNQAAPFLLCSFFYVAAFILLCFSWLSYRSVLSRAAYWLLVYAFVLHTLALAARVYISGRPPVTNLYSSAVFIGWGAVLLTLIIERFYRNGINSVIASVLGFNTLLIAHKLAGDGDTFEVLQAVLDTQFWLATHVVCITLGYATTFIAGFMGALYILRGMGTPHLDRRIGADFARMIYGTLCFAILFSFIGTVLGGLWADDSWGRFWGWDPKENGALIIVLWNALILHAKWDGVVRERGLAVLAVVGNVVTAWSWFGVNELGVGLHSYGFTEGRLVTLRNVILAHLVVVLIGWLPPVLWWSFRRRETAEI